MTRSNVSTLLLALFVVASTTAASAQVAPLDAAPPHAATATVPVEKPADAPEFTSRGPLVLGALVGSLAGALTSAAVVYSLGGEPLGDYTSGIVFGLSTAVTVPLGASLGTFVAGNANDRRGSLGRSFGRALGVSLAAASGPVILLSSVFQGRGAAAAGSLIAVPIVLGTVPFAAVKGYERSERDSLKAVSPTLTLDTSRGVYSLGLNGRF